MVGPVVAQEDWLWENPFANFWFCKLCAQVNVFNATYQADPQFSLKLLNYYIALAY